MWTNTSFPPSCGWMKPKPFWELKNLTVPVAMTASIENADRRPRAASRSQPYVRIRRCLGKSPLGQNKNRQKLERTLIWAGKRSISTPFPREFDRAADQVSRSSAAFQAKEPRDPDRSTYFLRVFTRVSCAYSRGREPRGLRPSQRPPSKISA